MRSSTAAVAFVAVGALASVACGGLQPVGPSQSAEVLSLKLETAHFRIWADHATPSTLQEIADRLETELPRFSADLGETAMPVTTVEVWTDLESYYADMVGSVGRRYDGSTGYIVGPTNVTILVTSNPARTACHELVHCVSMRANPTIANNPRWLWETVATYENGERVDPRTLGYLQAGSFPTLAQLNGDYAVTSQIYEVGFLIGEFHRCRLGQGRAGRPHLGERRHPARVRHLRSGVRTALGRLRAPEVLRDVAK